MGIGYNFNENYEKAIEKQEVKNFGYLNKFCIQNVDGTYAKDISSMHYLYSSKSNANLNEGEVILSYGVYNAFGLEETVYTTSNYKEFTPKQFKLIFYKNSNKKEEVVYEKTFTIVRLHTEDVYFNDQDAEALRKFDIIPYELYFDNNDKGKEIIELGENIKYMIFSGETTSLYTINKVLDVFGKFFIFLELFFLIVCLIYLVRMSISNVKKNTYEIGVMKALGITRLDLCRIFVRQTLLLGISILVIANIAILLGTGIANSILIFSFEAILEIKIINIVLISYVPKLVLIDLIDILVIIILSGFIPLIYINKIKPIDILRAKE